MFKQQLVALVLPSHRKHIPFHVIDMLRSLVIELHHLLLHQLLLCKPLPLCLFSLPLFELVLLLLFQFIAATFLGLARGLQSSLLIFILLEHAGLLVDGGGIRGRRHRWRGGRSRCDSCRAGG